MRRLGVTSSLGCLSSGRMEKKLFENGVVE